MSDRKNQQEVWLVTGCSSGLGKSFVKAIAENGSFVVATARKKETLSDLKLLYPNQIMDLTLDVTDKEQIRQVVQSVIARFGRIDGLVNNAGYGYRAAIEEGSDEDVALLFQTNFYGPVSLIKEVLPHMRLQRCGAIINISSIAATDTFPGSGYYGASKGALEGISSALQKEVAPLGIKVMVVEPGTFRTDFRSRSLKLSDIQISDYAETAGRRRIENARTDGTQRGDPDKGARLIMEVIHSEDVPFKLIVGSDAWNVYKQRERLQNEEMKPWLQKSIQTRFED